MDLIAACAKQVEERLVEAEKGHDWYHIQRVRKLALHLQSLEGGDRSVIELAALLHDIDDAKFNGGNEEAGAHAARDILENLKAQPELIDKVYQLVLNCSFKGMQAEDHPNIELQILRDADRLDAIGAIGIARTFHYGGYKNQALYDPDIPVRDKMSPKEYRQGKSSTINHFHEKLLKLKQGMYTATATKIAENRHRIMEAFIAQFQAEWEGLDWNGDKKD